MLPRYLSILTIFIGIYNIQLVTSKCSNETYGFYCKNIGSNHTYPIILESTKNEEAIFLRNVTGTITNDTFKSFPNLKWLDIRFSAINNFTANLVSLQQMYLIKNRLFPNLTSVFFEKYCRNVTTLIIQGNRGLHIIEGALEHAKNLSQLTVNDQNITQLSKDLLKGLDQLTYLNLKSNNILKIDGNAFEDLKNLNYLIINDNNITYFEENTFQNVKNLESIEMLNLNISSMNKIIFKNQRQLRYIGVPSKLIKKKITINSLTEIFTNLETVGISIQDKDDSDVKKFIETCKNSGFIIRLMN